MKSIKEKAAEHAQYTENDSWNRTQKCIIAQTSFEAGANYVLKQFVDIVNKNTKPNGMEDRAEMASDMLILIEQLKK